jgi:dienelactone hydrolase
MWAEGSLKGMKMDDRRWRKRSFTWSVVCYPYFLIFYESGAKNMISETLPIWGNTWQDTLLPAYAWQMGAFSSLETWKHTARAKWADLAALPTTRDLQVEEEIDCGSYVRKKISFVGASAWRVPGYVLMPKGEGPFPGVVAIHDHGAFFYWGKEKVVKTEALERAGLKNFVENSYEGQPFGDELARRGFAVIAIDGFFWGERQVVRAEAAIEGRVPETVEETKLCNRFLYEHQAMVALNVMQMGLTWHGVLLNDDLRSAQLLASLPQVDNNRVACCGLSVGSYRSWSLAAMSDDIQAGLGICWMATEESLTRTPSNYSKSQSAFSMLIPGMRRYLEIPDRASLSCPKPLLLYAGRQDGLFSQAGTDAAFAHIRAVYDAHGAGENFISQWWDVPHCFNQEMQGAAFDWLERVL